MGAHCSFGSCVTSKELGFSPTYLSRLEHLNPSQGDGREERWGDAWPNEEWLPQVIGFEDSHRPSSASLTRPIFTFERSN